MHLNTGDIFYSVLENIKDLDIIIFENKILNIHFSEFFNEFCITYKRTKIIKENSEFVENDVKRYMSKKAFLKNIDSRDIFLKYDLNNILKNYINVNHSSKITENLKIKYGKQFPELFIF